MPRDISKKLGIFSVIFLVIFLMGCNDDSINSKEVNEVVNSTDKRKPASTYKITNRESAAKMVEDFEYDLIEAFLKRDFSLVEAYFINEDHNDYEKLFWQGKEYKFDSNSIADKSIYGSWTDVKPFYRYAIENEASDSKVKISKVSIDEAFDYSDGYSFNATVQYEINGQQSTIYPKYMVYQDENNNGYIVSGHDLVTTNFNLDSDISYLADRLSSIIKYKNYDQLNLITNPDTDFYQEVDQIIQQDGSFPLIEASVVAESPWINDTVRVIFAEYMLSEEKNYVEYILEGDENKNYKIVTRKVIKTKNKDTLLESDKLIIDKYRNEALRVAEEITTGLVEAINNFVNYGNTQFIEAYILPDSQLYSEYKSVMENYISNAYRAEALEINIKDIRFVDDIIEVDTYEVIQMSIDESIENKEYERTYKIQQLDNEGVAGHSGNYFGYYITDMIGSPFE